MKTLARWLKCPLFFMALAWAGPAFGDNQTATISPIFSEQSLPFRVQIELADFALPNGIQSYAFAVYRGKWLLLAGRTNGLHDFSSGDNNFPPQKQNRVVYVVDPIRKTVAARALTDPGSGLSVQQVDLLSVTSPQFYQAKETLYLVGGYGVDQLTGQFSTKAALTAIDVPGLIHWVTHPSCGETAAQHLRHIFNPAFQVTGGLMTQMANQPNLLVFGQNFQGFYTSESNGLYTQQIRRFYVLREGKHLMAAIQDPFPKLPDPHFRRRDLNVVPIVKVKHGRLVPALVAYSGVFTLTGGAWTVPVEINARGVPHMADPLAPDTFKQGMNNYACATVGLFSKQKRAMYTVFLGGISFGYFTDGQFQTDPELPFINQVTTIEIDRHGRYKQYLMDAEYPFLVSTQSNPGNRLLFGAGSQLILADDVSCYGNGVLKLDRLDEPQVVGYVVGGIQSTLPNTNSGLDSAASPYIFKVTVIPTGG